MLIIMTIRIIIITIIMSKYNAQYSDNNKICFELNLVNLIFQDWFVYYKRKK